MTVLDLFCRFLTSLFSVFFLEILPNLDLFLGFYNQFYLQIMSFTYNFQTDDELIFQKWDLAKIGSSVLDSQKTSQKTWTVVMPPPNLTGNLHAGHALEHYLMDSLSRFERQNLENYQGKQVLYYPGSDHAGIQLEGVINKLVNQGEFDDFLKNKLGENFENLTEISPLKIQIRKAKNSDAEKILEINKNSWIATYPSVEFGITKAEIENKNWQNKIEKIRQSLETENVNNYVLEIIGN